MAETRTWKVQSSSNKKLTYTVAWLPTGQWECTCPAYTKAHRVCKHITAIRSKYDKQSRKSKPARAQSRPSALPSDGRGPGQKRGDLQSGELRGSDREHGKPTAAPVGTQPTGSAGHRSSGENAEVVVGPPTPSTDVPGPTEGSNPAEAEGNIGVSPQDQERERLKAQTDAQRKQYEEWELRETPASKKLHVRLSDLRTQYKNESDKEKRKTIELMARPIKTAIKDANRRLGQTPPFDIALLAVQPEKVDEFEATVIQSLF